MTGARGRVPGTVRPYVGTQSYHPPPLMRNHGKADSLVDDLGRLHVHLGEELKFRLKALHSEYGDLSTAIRELIRAYVEGLVMPIDPKINEYLDSGDDTKVIELLTQHLTQLRSLRLQARSAAAAEKTHKNMTKGLENAGVKTAAEKMVEQMLGALKGGMPVAPGKPS